MRLSAESSLVAVVVADIIHGWRGRVVGSSAPPPSLDEFLPASSGRALVSALLGSQRASEHCERVHLGACGCRNLHARLGVATRRARPRAYACLECSRSQPLVHGSEAGMAVSGKGHAQIEQAAVQRCIGLLEEMRIVSAAKKATEAPALGTTFHKRGSLLHGSGSALERQCECATVSRIRDRTQRRQHGFRRAETVSEVVARLAVVGNVSYRGVCTRHRPQEALLMAWERQCRHFQHGCWCRSRARPRGHPDADRSTGQVGGTGRWSNHSMTDG